MGDTSPWLCKRCSSRSLAGMSSQRKTWQLEEEWLRTRQGCPGASIQISRRGRSTARALNDPDRLELLIFLKTTSKTARTKGDTQNQIGHNQDGQILEATAEKWATWLSLKSGRWWKWPRAIYDSSTTCMTER